MPNSNDRLTIDRFSLSLRVDANFLPFSVEELVPGLEQLGFTITDDLKQILKPGAKPLGARVSVDGGIANKADPPLQVRLDMRRGILAVDGKQIEPVIGEYLLIENWINDEMDLNLGQEAKFYETILEGLLTVGIDRNPLETLKRLYTDGGQIQEFSRIIGQDVTNYGIRLVVKGQAPTDDTWFDLRIEPSLQRSNSAYHINAVSRGPQLEPQADEARQLSNKLSQLVSAMEKGN